MSFYMLDTNAASEALRGHPAFDARLQALAPGQWCISAVTCSELSYGMARRPDATRLRRIIDEFLRIVPILAWDAQVAQRHGALRAWLHSAGRPIGEYDEMIAAHALETNAILVTDNTKHFQRVPGLVIENWLRPPSPRA